MTKDITVQGTLYGIGVGAGDPELLTLKAIRYICEVDQLFAASSSKNSFSIAEDIVRPHLPDDKQVQHLSFPMTRNEDELKQAWKHNAVLLLEQLDQGKSVGFLTLGDPLLYSTFGYVLQTIREMKPDQPIEIIPGITSFQAAAAKTQTILAESGEVLQIIPGIAGEEALRHHLNCAENSVILKAYKNFPMIRKVLREHDQLASSVFVSRLFMEGEVVSHDLNELPENPNYLSLIISKS